MSSLSAAAAAVAAAQLQRMQCCSSDGDDDHSSSDLSTIEQGPTMRYVFDTDNDIIVDALNRFSDKQRGELYFLELWRPRAATAAAGSDTTMITDESVAFASPSPSPTPTSRGRRRRVTSVPRKRFPLVCLKRFPSANVVGPYEREALVGPFLLEDGERQLAAIKRNSKSSVEEYAQYVSDLAKDANVLRWIDFSSMESTPNTSAMTSLVSSTNPTPVSEAAARTR